MKCSEEKIFRKYDLRGLFGLDFKEDFAFKLGLCLGSYLKKNKLPLGVSVGRDMRNSSDKIHKKLVEGLLKSSCDVFDLGLIHTPMSYFSAFHYSKIYLSVMITASHNPKEHNGFKFSIKGKPFFDQKIEDLKNIFLNKSYKESSLGTYKEFCVKKDYIDFYKKQFKDLTGIPFSIDSGNGAVGFILKDFLKNFNLSGKLLYLKPDGNFPNHPCDPCVEKHYSKLKNICKKENIIGFSFDGDGDRLGLIDEKGQFITADKILFVLSQTILKSKKQAKIVFDVKSSDILPEKLTEKKARPILSPSGHSYIREKVISHKAQMGGEFAGHFVFNDKNYPLDDGLYSFLRILEVLKKEKKKFYELLSWPKVFSSPEIRLPIEEKTKEKIFEEFKKKFKSDKIIEIDGLRFSRKNSFVLIRPSNTEPLLVLRFEARTKKDFCELENKIKKILLKFSVSF